MKRMSDTSQESVGPSRGDGDRGTSRRGFVHGALAVAFSLPAGLRAQARRRESRYDVAIIGAGTAGIPAAVMAARSGASVLLVEKAPVHGGTLHVSGASLAAAGTVFQERKGIHDSPDEHFADNMRINGQTADPALTRLYVDNAPAAVNWLAKNGFEVRDTDPSVGGVHTPFSIPRYTTGIDSGRSVLKAMEAPLQQAIGAGHVTLLTSTRAVGLLQDRLGTVSGVVLENADGRRDSFNARNVVLAAGGSMGSPSAYQQIHGFPLYANAGYSFCEGDGVFLGLAAGGFVRGAELYLPIIGAIVADDDIWPSSLDGTIVTDPRLRAPWEVHVNSQGRRFVREDHPSIDYREKALARQPGHRQWLVFDQDAFERAPPLMPRLERDAFAQSFNSHPMFSRAATVQELGLKAGIDPGALQESVGAYNDAIVRGTADPFGRVIRPAPLARAPFYSVRMQGYSLASWAGLAVDGTLRVLRPNGSAVSGLYAVGEVLGGAALSGGAYTQGSLATGALSLGFHLGRRLAKR